MIEKDGIYVTKKKMDKFGDKPVTTEKWVIDATMGCRKGLFCFCQVVGDLDNGNFSVVTGMNYISSKRPPNGEFIRVIVHADGQQAAEEFSNNYARELENV